MMHAETVALSVFVGAGAMWNFMRTKYRYPHISRAVYLMDAAWAVTFITATYFVTK